VLLIRNALRYLAALWISPDAEEIKETGGETSIRGFIRLLPLVRPYVSRFSNATSDTRGMPRTFTKWQLPQLWYSRRAIVAGFMDRQSPPTPLLS
jgi:hypothetical protein